MNEHLPEYPKGQLIRARDIFALRWHQVLNTAGLPKLLRNPDANAISSVDFMHRNSPPDVEMLNTHVYPFLEADAIKRPIHQLISQRGSMNPPKTVNSSPGPNDPVIRKGKRKKKARHKASDSSSASSSSPPEKRPGLSSNGRAARVFYSCDCCDEAGVLTTKVAALGHLAESGHASCSRYQERPAVAPMAQLVAPRCVVALNEDQMEDFGWNKGETVVYCPTCHLIMPDKVRAGGTLLLMRN